MSALFPLTPLQEGMLFESTASGRPWVNLEQIVVHLDGEPVDAAAMQIAWQGLTDATPALRMVIDTGGADQRLHAPAAIALRELDWSGEAAAQENLDEWLAQDRIHGVEPQVFPAFRLALIRFGPDRAAPVWTLPHTLLDGRSMTKLLADAFARYATALAGEAQPDGPAGGGPDAFGAHEDRSSLWFR